MKEFLDDVEGVRARILREFGRGTTRDWREAGRTVRLLNEALALNFVCVLRHMRHFVTADRFDARAVAQEFLEHTVRESELSDLVSARITQLGGEITIDRDSMTSRGHFSCDSSHEFEDIIRIDLDAEHIAIATYRQMTEWLADVDPISSCLLQQILLQEEEHAEIMRNVGVVAVVNE